MGVLCCSSTPEVHLAGKHICEAVFLGVSGSMFLTTTARNLESTAEDGEERVGINFTFAKDRRLESTLSRSA